MAIRQSNIELLRGIAIFMIIAVHADYWLLGAPTHTDFIENLSSSFWRIFWECVTVVGVNIFVLISGWFGIRPSIKSFSSFIFQIAFFLIGIFIIGVVLGLTQFSFKSLASCFLFTSGNWFIKSYIGLYILAPVLNMFIDKASKKQYFTTIMLFYLFQTIYGWSNSALFVEQGYSTFSFIGLYLLARYVRIYVIDELKFKGTSLFIISTAVNIILSLISIYLGIDGLCYYFISYANPLVILGALGLVITFAKWSLGYNKFINLLGRSSFAVYLFPCWFIFDFIYRELIMNVYISTSGFVCFSRIFMILACTFFVAIGVDQIRILVWNYIWNRLSPHIHFKKIQF